MRLLWILLAAWFAISVMGVAGVALISWLYKDSDYDEWSSRL
tara:strand:+ start:1024 stop:1149 length:126 start_codon:yes stop_codon:yes gene_type:complete